ncbi:MAG: undecaprenyldiphospho-muramoylpentapeptide beta-N-acetylglucosaminyltransferase [Deltaproteobacteria bacterium]|nr:undecaprenyldiphospho-muramoylpentapeptide beta-N-acetylglucosaminyltransferase [Deltaproteobacteria bacterium]
MKGVILLAGGGTGGHVFPLVALAEAFADVAPNVEVRFVGTSKGLEARVVPARGWTLETLAIEPMKGRSWFGAARGGMIAGAAIVRAIGLVARLKPILCVSIGGYAAGPVGVAAASLGVPLALLEPNRVAGMTQRLLTPLARRVYVGFRESLGPLARKGRALGIPLRKGFSPRPTTVRDGALRLFVTGGSQGAQHLNEVMPAAVADLISRGAALEVVHQAGRGRADEVRARYGESGNAKDVQVVEFVEDVPARLSWAHLVVSRSGALTCAELCAIGRPSILVPYPFAADDHQAANAEALAKAAAAIAIRQKEATVERLVEAISGVYGDETMRLSMADAARARGVPDAAQKIAEDLLELATGPRR